MSHDVFISYANKNKKIADAVCAKLEERGVRCWIAPRDIMPGSSYAESIVQAIDESRSMVLVFSSEANRSSHVKREAERAVHDGIPIVPFRIEDVEPSAELGYFFGSQHWLDAVTPPLEQHIFALADAIKVLIGDAKPHLEEPQAGPLVEPPAGQAAPTPRLPSASTLLRNKTVIFSIVALILVALVGGGLYASGLLTPHTAGASSNTTTLVGDKIVYQNNALGVKFSYPETWRTNESQYYSRYYGLIPPLNCVGDSKFIGFYNTSTYSYAGENDTATVLNKINWDIEWYK